MSAPTTNTTAAATAADDRLVPAQAWRLYLSHFLSMWNSRTYEYAAILFIQAAFPGDLLPSSINGIAETVCVLVSAGTLGRWVDEARSRLRPLLLTIVINRVTLVVCCLLWIFLFLLPQGPLRLILFALILGLGMVEKASRMGNMLSMERDWIPTLADDDQSHATRPAYDLTHLTTVIRRIDIVCKFIAPLVISSVMAFIEPTLSAMAIGGVGAMSMAVELWTAMIVWRLSRRLQLPKSAKATMGMAALRAETGAVNPASAASSKLSSLSRQLRLLVERLKEMVLGQIDGVKYYFSTEIWLPSLGTAVLHASVLAWSGTLITWLLNAGLSLPQVTIAKGVGAVFEIGSTLLFPWAVGYFRRHETDGARSSTSYQPLNRDGMDSDQVDDPRPEEEDAGEVDVTMERPHTGSSQREEELGTPNLHQAVVRVASWAIVGMAVTLVPTVIALFYLDRLVSGDSSDPSKPPGTSFVAISFFALLSISFLGRWTYDLAITQLTLMLVPASHRSSFGGTEIALVSTVSLVHWTASAIWHAQDDFRWLSLASMCAVIGAAVAYVRWTRQSLKSGPR